MWSAFLSMCGQCSALQWWSLFWSLLYQGWDMGAKGFSGFFLWPKISFPKALERPRAESIPPHTDTWPWSQAESSCQKDSWQHFLTLRASRMIITAVRNGELQLLGSCLVTPLLTTGQLPDIVHRDIYLIYHMLLWLGDLSENDQLRN